MASLLENLCCYQDGGKSFVESIITGDETLVYRFTPESKKKLAHYKIEPSAKKKKKQWH
jgi:hypothetical protein